MNILNFNIKNKSVVIFNMSVKIFIPSLPSGEEILNTLLTCDISYMV